MGIPGKNTDEAAMTWQTLIDAWPVFVAAAVVVFLWRTLPGRKRK